MDQGRCSRCGKEIVVGDTGHCRDCQDQMRRRRLKGRWFLASIVAIMIFAGVVYVYGEKNAWDFSWDGLLGRPVAVVNGESVARSALRERLNISRRMVEREYGKELFTGERGKSLLADLERDVLGKMIEERLVIQEAYRMKIAVTDESVQQELQTIGREIYGTWEKFQANLKEDGISPEYITAHVRNLLLFREVKKAKTPPGVNPDQYAAVWLVQAKQNARITLNRTASPVQAVAASQGAASCCSTGGGGGGCGTKQSGPLDPRLKSEASAAALAAYRKTNPDEKDVTAQVTDYGCHVQVDIEKGGRVVKSYAYQDGQAFEN